MRLAKAAMLAERAPITRRHWCQNPRVPQFATLPRQLAFWVHDVQNRERGVTVQARSTGRAKMLAYHILNIETQYLVAEQLEWAEAIQP